MKRERKRYNILYNISFRKRSFETNIHHIDLLTTILRSLEDSSDFVRPGIGELNTDTLRF